MSAEHREGPRPSLFPLDRKSIATATTVMRHRLSREPSSFLPGYREILLERTRASQDLRGFLDECSDELAFNPDLQQWYNVGSIVQLDALLLESDSKGIEIPHINPSDIDSYKKGDRAFRFGPAWYTQTPEALWTMLDHIKLGITGFQFERDNRTAELFSSGMAEIVEGIKGDAPTLRNELTYTLGIADVYFPYRFALKRIYTGK